MEAARCRDEDTAASEELNACLEPLAPSTATTPSSVHEIVVTSAEGEVLYERGAKEPQERVAVLKVLHNVAQRFGDSLGLGTLERVEFPGAEVHMTARLQEHGSVFVRGVLMQ